MGERGRRKTAKTKPGDGQKSKEDRTLLELRELCTGYGEVRVLQGMSFSVASGSVHALLGRNGVGKTTTLKAISGLLPVHEGTLRFEGASLVSRPPFTIARLGIAHVPETRDIFTSLSVLENLKLSARLAPRQGALWSFSRIWELFPQLAARRNHGGGQLSGGEQQMLAIARALLANPRLLILDEPTEGLAPLVVETIFKVLSHLKAEGMTMLMVEQNMRFVTRLADRASLLGRGICVWEGSPAQLQDNPALRERWLGI